MKVGVIVPLGEDDKLKAVRPYREIRSLAQKTEAAGLDSVWIYDHLFYHFEGKEPQGVHEAWTVWTGLAEATNRVELGALVLCTAFRNPAVLAKMAVALDEVSEGRIILGLGAGWHKPEFDAFGLDFSHLVDQFEENISIIAPLVKKGEVDFQGRYVNANQTQLLPRPQREIPILVASFKPRMLDLTARWADQWNTAWLGHASALESRWTEMKAACEREGRDPKTLEVTVGINVVFPELGGDASQAEKPDKAIVGTVAEVRAALDEYRALGVGHLIAALDPLTEGAIALLAEAARPA